LSNVQERNIMLEPFFAIYLNSKRVPEDLLKFVNEVQVEDEEDKLPLAMISVLDDSKLWLNTKGVVKGATLRVVLGHRHNYRQMFDGKITQVEAVYPVEGTPSLVITAVDKAVKLMDEREARNFKKTKVSDVVKIMLKECGLKYDVEDTGAVIDHIPQEKESNLEFITRWRKKLGWKFYRISGTDIYYFGKEKKNKKVKTLGYKTGGMEIISFSPSYQDHETSDEDSKESDIDNNGTTTTVTVRDTKGAIKYPGLNNTSSPIGRA
jgi:hypothetical protein